MTKPKSKDKDYWNRVVNILAEEFVLRVMVHPELSTDKKFITSFLANAYATGYELRQVELEGEESK